MTKDSLSDTAALRALLSETPDTHLLAEMLAFVDGNGRCSASGGCEACRNSPPFMPPSPTISTRNAASRAGTNSRPTAPPLSPSGAVSARHKGQSSCPW
jgi:hypothetical protein